MPPLPPGPLLPRAQLGQQLLSENPVPAAPAERLPDVGEQLLAHAVPLFGGAVRQRDGRPPCPLRPLAAGQVGDRQQRPPVVGGPVPELRRHLGVRRAQLGQVIGGPARCSPPQRLEVTRPVEPQPLHLLARSAAAHRHHDAPACQRVGEPSDHRHGLGSPGREPARLVLVPDRAHHVCGIPRVAAIEDAAQLLLLPQEGVRLVDQQRRRVLLHHPEERRRRDVRAEQSSRHQAGEQRQRRRLAAPLLWRRKGQ